MEMFSFFFYFLNFIFFEILKFSIPKEWTSNGVWYIYIYIFPWILNLKSQENGRVGVGNRQL